MDSRCGRRPGQGHRGGVLSAKDGNAGIGCGGALFIVLALGILLGLAGMGSDEDSWCPPDHWACQEGER